MIKKPKNPNRIARVNSYIQQNLSVILREFLSEQKGITTISKVETSRDMKWAKIWISILGGNPHPSRQVGTPSPTRLRQGFSGQEGRGEISLSLDAPSSDKKILDYIQKNIYYIQGELNKTFKTKIIPRVQFFLDTSPRYAQHIEEVIKKIHEEE
jgi:ribosome-binding factor A